MTGSVAVGANALQSATTEIVIPQLDIMRS